MTVKEVIESIKAERNENGDIIYNRFSKKKFTDLMKAIANDINFTAKLPVVKEGKLDHLEDIMVSENFRKWCRKLVEKAGMDKKESEIVMNEDFPIESMDGLYEFFSTALYEYMAAGNKFELMPREDFKGSIFLKEKDETVTTRECRDPRTGENLGMYEQKKGRHMSLAASSPCPEYLKNRKKV